MSLSFYVCVSLSLFLCVSLSFSPFECVSFFPSFHVFFSPFLGVDFPPSLVVFFFPFLECFTKYKITNYLEHFTKQVEKDERKEKKRNSLLQRKRRCLMAFWIVIELSRMLFELCSRSSFESACNLKETQ